MTILTTAPARVLGFDVAKDTITVFDSFTGTLKTIANRRAAVRALLVDLDPHCFGVCEPTGGYEVLLLEQLGAAGIACHRADTLKVKAFIRSFGTLAKTDALDARALALYGQERWQRLALFSPADSDQQALAALVTRRQELGALKVAEQNRVKAPGRAAINASCRAMVRVIVRQIARIDADTGESHLKKLLQLRG